jgi:hypothetical protein
VNSLGARWRLANVGIAPEVRRVAERPSAAPHMRRTVVTITRTVVSGADTATRRIASDSPDQVHFVVMHITIVVTDS